MRASSLLLALLLLPAAAPAQQKTEKRLTGLEKRVTKAEQRLTKLEGGFVPASGKAEAKPLANPIAVTFLKKKQQLGQQKMGIRLYMEFENLANRRFYAFNGTLVFKDENGALIWAKPYGHTEPLAAGEKVQVSMGILSDQAREYLKFVRAKAVTVTLEKQEVYGAE